MTLIISVATRDFVIQAGDRLVTVVKDPSGPWLPYDEQSNKQVVFACDDAVGVAGYSGLAFLSGLPADHVIAEALAGREVRYSDGRLATIVGGTPPDPNDLDAATRRLQTQLDERIAAEPRRPGNALGLYLDMVGWLARPEALEPFFFTYEKAATPGQDVPGPSSSELHVGRSDDERRPYAIGVVPPRSRTAARLRRMATRLGGGPLAPRIVVDWLTGQIRREASMNPAVGADVMAVVLPRPDPQPRVLIEYRPSKVAPEVPLVSAGGRRVRVGPGSYCPWITTPGVLQPPQIIAPGRQTLVLDGVTIEILGPASRQASGIVFASGSMPERRSPQT